MLTGCSGGEWRRPNSSQLPILTVHNNNRISLVLPKRTKTGKLDPSDNFGGSCKKTLIFCSFQRTFGNTSRVSKEVLYLVLVLLYHVAIIWKKCNIEAVLKDLKKNRADCQAYRIICFENMLYVTWFEKWCVGPKWKYYQCQANKRVGRRDGLLSWWMIDGWNEENGVKDVGAHVRSSERCSHRYLDRWAARDAVLDAWALRGAGAWWPPAGAIHGNGKASRVFGKICGSALALFAPKSLLLK